VIREKLTNKPTQQVGGLLKDEFGDCHAMSAIFINDSYCDKLWEHVATYELPLTHAKSCLADYLQSALGYAFDSL
jgi:hypothetical protein